MTMGIFDDLIPPQQNQPVANASPPVSGSMFDDLIPSAAPAQQEPSPFYGENPFTPSQEMAKRFEQIKDIETRSETAPGTWREIDRIANKQQDYGLGNAALQGLTFGFGDEAKAAARAAGGEDYSVALAGEREGLKRYREDHPTKALLAELGGALPTVLIPGLNVARGANLAARVGNAAATGAAYGALYGAGTGEGAPGRAISSGTGGILGGLFGGVVPLGVSAVKGAAGAVDHALGNVGSMVRGAVNPEKEASRIVINALERDNPNISDLPGHAVAEMGIAQGRGQPLAVGDLGARHTRAAAKDAARTSIEAKGDLQDLLYGRAGESQGQRLTDFVNHLMGGNTNADARRQALESAAKSQNRAAYERAYREGDVGVWSPEIAGRLASDAFRGAVRDATRIGSDVAGASGERAVRNPFVFNEAGQGFLRKKADGSVEIPNLRFWDKVKQSLDSQIGRAQRAGDKGEVGRLTQLKNAFVADLDAAVPSYADARRGAAAFFGADDALSAGENFVSMKFGAPETRRALTKMSPAERQLFAEGFASRLVDTIKAIPDNRNAAINAAFNNPAARERLTMALGKRRADQLESFLRVENIMDMMKRAVTGGSDTFENFMRMGVASTLGATASGVATGSTDPVNLAIGAIVGGLTRKGAGVVNEAVARRVGEMLASNDPVIVRQALDRIGRSPALKRGIVDLEGLFTRALGVSLGMHGPRPLGSPGEHVGAYNNGG